MAATAPDAGRVLDRLFDRIPAGTAADARLLDQRWTTIRFANSYIHQPHVERERSLTLRVGLDGRFGWATTTATDPAALDALVREATSMARVAPPEKKFPGFRRSDGPVRPVVFSRATAELRPEAAAEFVRRVIASADRASPGARVSGVLNVGDRRLRVRNTAGLDRADRRSLAQSSVLVERPERDPPVSGWTETADWDVRRMSPEALGREAAERVAPAAPRPVPPGEYRVLLGGSAVAEMMGILGYLGFSAQSFEEGWSCLRSKVGRRIGDARVHVVDDARDPASLPQALDWEGSRKRATPLIEHGIARGPVTDLVSAGRLGRGPTTGHALPGDVGPQPEHQVMAAGDASAEELIRETRRGILVTRFWYVRVVHPGHSTITGMTRDGTYLIERGEVVGPARNLRFTQSILETVAHVRLLGRERRRYSDERGSGAVTCPALVADRFHFTSATLF